MDLRSRRWAGGLKQLGKETAECIVATEDESLTYNNRVNRLPPIQCHKMIVRAVRNGIKPERIAAALDMPLKVVQGLITLLDGINEDVVLEVAQWVHPREVWLASIWLKAAMPLAGSLAPCSEDPSFYPRPPR